MEAMAYGVPVVTTREGVEGMEFDERRSTAFVAEDDELIAERVCALLDDRPTAARDPGRRRARCSSAATRRRR